MEILKNTIYAVVAIVVLVFGLSSLIPPTFKVERSIEIEATQDKIFPHIVDLKQWKNWGVWYERDPKMEVKYSGPDQQVGMKSEWSSPTEGSGYMEIIEIEPNTKVVYNLVFPDVDMKSKGKLVLEAKDGKTTVTWTDAGKIQGNPLNRYFLLFLDSMIGPDFEAGLKNLKRLSED